MAFIKAAELKTLKDDLASLQKENQRLKELLEQSEKARQETAQQRDESLKALRERDDEIRRWESLSRTLDEELETGFCEFALRGGGSVYLNLSSIQEFCPIMERRSRQADVEIGCKVNGEHDLILASHQLHWVIARKRDGAPLDEIQEGIKAMQSKNQSRD